MMIAALLRSKRPASPRRSSSAKNADVQSLWACQTFSNRSRVKRVPALISCTFDAGTTPSSVSAGPLMEPSFVIAAPWRRRVHNHETSMR